PERLAGDRLDRREGVLDTVVKLVEEQALQILRPLALADVARDLRGPDDPSASVADGTDRQRDVDAASVLGHPDGVERLDTLAAPQPGEDLLLLLADFL